MISICEYGRLKTAIFRKAISKNMLLRADSNHSRNPIKDIAIEQFLRLRWNCSEDDDFQSKASELKETVNAGGYPMTNIDSAYQRAVSIDRHSLLDKKPKRQISSRVCFTAVYNPASVPIKQTILKHWHILAYKAISLWVISIPITH